MSVWHVYVNQQLFQALILELENEWSTTALTTIIFEFQKETKNKNTLGTLELHFAGIGWVTIKKLKKK